MPCYTAWYERLKPNTPEYASAKRIVEGQLAAVKHIVNYYYRAMEFPLPSLPAGIAINPLRQPKSERESAIRNMICHPFACDGIDFCTLYDVCSLTDTDDPEQKRYAAVILPCASLMRKFLEKYRPSY